MRAEQGMIEMQSQMQTLREQAQQQVPDDRMIAENAVFQSCGIAC